MAVTGSLVRPSGVVRGGEGSKRTPVDGCHPLESSLSRAAALWLMVRPGHMAKRAGEARVEEFPPQSPQKVKPATKRIVCDG